MNMFERLDDAANALVRIADALEKLVRENEGAGRAAPAESREEETDARTR